MSRALPFHPSHAESLAQGLLAAGLPARVAIVLFQVKRLSATTEVPGPHQGRAEGALLEMMAILSW